MLLGRVSGSDAGPLLFVDCKSLLHRRLWSDGTELRFKRDVPSKRGLVGNVGGCRR